MDERVRDALQDMLECAEEAAALVARRDASEVLADRTQRLAAERLLEILGEAATRVPDAVRAKIDLPWRKIVGLRNLLIHAYHRIDPVTLEGVLQQEAPRVARAIQRFLRDRAADDV